MASTNVFRGFDLLFLLTTTYFSFISCQSDSTGDNIYDSLDGLGCTIFKNIISEAQRVQVYRSQTPMTLFVFNDTAYGQLPANKRELYPKDDNNQNGAQEYVNSFTLLEAKTTESFDANHPYNTASMVYRVLFLDKRQLTLETTASGTPGPTKYFCNGGMIIRKNIRAGAQVIHILDRVLEMQWPANALAFADRRNPRNLRYRFYEELMDPLMRSSSQEDPVFNYLKQIWQPLSGKDSAVTFFLPTDEALGRIPTEQLSKLKGDNALLLKILALHVVPNKVLFTSLVNHNERFPTQMNSGTIMFRKNFNKDAVYVTGSLNGGRTVTALINPPNMAVLNGVVHQIDQILGFVYKSAIEEIKDDQNTRNFDTLLTRVRPSLRSELNVPSGVTIFVPWNAALNAIDNVYPNYKTNTSLINMLVEFSMLQRNERLSLTDYNKGYDSLISAVSRYNGRRVKVYSQGNDTWVEGGYVRARVIKPDIGVTNGVVHQIDAVFGIPTRDLPYSIFCEGWLEQSYIQMTYTGLAEYTRDPMLTANQQCVFRDPGGTLTSGGSIPNRGSSSGQSSTQNTKFDQLCGGGRYRCEFTFFVPNGTAIESFSHTQHGRLIMNDKPRWRWLLRRLLSYNEKIYIDQIALGSLRSFTADNGETVFISVEQQGSYSSGQRKAYLLYQGVRAEIIHSDLGATNGVYHIINSILYTSEDSYRDVSHASRLAVSYLAIVCGGLAAVLLAAGEGGLSQMAR